MLRDDVEVGKVYAAKVSDSICPVQINKETNWMGSRFEGDGTNLATRKSVHIKSAQRLRYELVPSATPGKWVRKGL